MINRNLMSKNDVEPTVIQRNFYCVTVFFFAKFSVSMAFLVLGMSFEI